MYGSTPFGTQCSNTFKNSSLIVVADHQIYPFDSGQFLRFELGITARYHDNRPGIFFDQTTYALQSILIGMLRYRATVNHVDVGPLATDGTHESSLFESAGDRGGFGEVKFAAERIKPDFFHRRHLGIVFEADDKCTKIHLLFREKPVVL